MLTYQVALSYQTDESDGVFTDEFVTRADSMESAILKATSGFRARNRDLGLVTVSGRLIPGEWID